jgi:hypothetical protein
MEVNYGDCYKWAWIAYKIFNDVELWSHESHAFIRYRRKFYDSETLNGIENWHRIRTIKENAAHYRNVPAIKMSPIQYVEYWNVLNDCDWSGLNEKIDGVKNYLASERPLPGSWHGNFPAVVY